MKIYLFSSNGCYPCEKAQDVVAKILKENPLIDIIKVTRPDPLFASYGVVMVPTLLIDPGDKPGAALVGVSNITKVEVEGLLRDFGFLQ